MAQFTILHYAFFGLLLTVFWLLLTERIPNDLVAVLTIVALTVTGLLSPRDALSGFGSEPAIVVASVFILSAALHQTGISEMMGAWIGRLAGHSYTRTLVVVMPLVAALSAFTHHVTTTAVMLPVLLNFSRENSIPSSKLLMPLSFAASMGTTITIIGAPAFLVASAILQQAGRPGLSIFSITPIGLVLSLVSLFFMLLIGQYLLPSNTGTFDLNQRFRIDQYLTELKIGANSPFVGKTLDEIKKDSHYHFTVVGWLRNKRRLFPAFATQQLAADDVLIVHTTPEDLTALHHEKDIVLYPMEQYHDEYKVNFTAEIGPELVQAVVAPGADFIGTTLQQIDFRRRFGAIVIGFWRQNEFLQEELAQIQLQAGDVLVLRGDAEALARVQQDPGFLLLIPFHGEAQLRRKAPIAATIMGATILATAFNLLPLEIAMMTGAVAVVLTGCLTVRQAYHAIDVHVYIFIAGAIPLGLAMQQTGAADLVAQLMRQLMQGWNEFAVLLAIYAIVGLVTQLMSDAGTVALFGPVAVALAHALGRPPEPYVLVTAMAAVTACLTPTGHHGNLLVYGPGGYRYRDFVQVGGGLTICVAVVVVLLTQMLWS